jgi:hypothetical protein
MIRIFLHLSDFLFIGQLVILYLVSSAQYGNTYTLDILSGDDIVYRFAWALLGLNYLQIAAYGMLGLFILFDLGKSKLCKKHTISNLKEGKKDKQNI